MLEDWQDILGYAVLTVVLYCASVALTVSYFQISDASQVIIVAKALSLMLLVAVGQSEALQFYLKQHTTNQAGRVVMLNRAGITVTAIAVVILAAKLLAPPNGTPDVNDAHWLTLWRRIQPFADLIAFAPIVFFSFVDIMVWVHLDKTAGRICFVLADVPVLVPMAILVILSIGLVGSSTEQFHLLIGGGTILFILVSIMLNNCAHSLLETSRDLSRRV